MAKLKFTPNNAFSTYDMDQARLDFPALLNNYNQATLSSSEINLSTNTSNRTVLYGDDLTYTSDDGKLILTGGKFTGMDIRIGGKIDLIEITDLNMSASKFGGLLSAGSVDLYDLIFASSDEISGAGGNDLLRGFEGNDILNGLGGSDKLFGDEGNDQVLGGDGNDSAYGGVGNDRLLGEGGNDRLDGEAGADAILGGSGNDTLNGGTEADQLFGDDGNDRLFGDAGNDALNGGTENDYIDGGEGKDVLTGGDGRDVFVFSVKPGAANRDAVTDFNVASDTINLENAVFIGLPNGTLKASKFASNETGRAEDRSDRIIYEEDTGKVYYDRDGDGRQYKGVHFATLDDDLSLTRADFFIF